MRPLSILFIVLSIFLCCSCEKVISVHLNNSAPQYVIVGNITNEPGVCQVSITQTKDFSDDNTFPGITGATVTVENNGAVTQLTESGNGNYQAGTITGKPGDTWHLTVKIGSQVFSATSTMPQPVNMDTIYVTTERLSDNKNITAVYKDPPGVQNYYRFVQYLNDKKEKSIFVRNDELTDGQTIKAPLDFSNNTDDSTRDIKSGDEVRIEMLCIDADVYKYWNSLDEGSTGDNQSASPANPVTNISGGALGYFSAHTIQRKTLRVP